MTSRSKFIVFLALGPLWVVGSSIPSGFGPALAQTNPCQLPVTTQPPPGLQAPKNLKIIKGLLETVEELVSGPAVDETVEPPQTTTHAYFNMLANRADCRVAFGLRSQAEIDSVPTGSEGVNKWDIVYDGLNDAMVQRAKGVFPDGTKAGLNMEQKQPLIKVSNTSMLLTYDYKIGPGAKYQAEGYLKQYKAYRLDSGGGTELWLSTKLKFPIGATEGIAEMLTTGGWYAGPGVTNSNSEILEPRVARFFPRVNTWTRYWVYVEGKLGGAAAERSELVYVSIWAADETRDPIQLYNRLPMYSPVADIRRFRFEMNTSETSAANPLIEIWGRNFVVLTGLSLADAKSLLQKPLK